MIRDPSPNKPRRSLDRIDQEILRALQTNGRKPVSELAREVRLTTTPCLDRVRRLEKGGYIKGYRALLDPNRLGLSLLAFVEIRVDATTAASCDQLRATIASMEEIIECHKITGEFDYLLKLRVSDMNAYRQFLDGRLTQLPGIERTRTVVVVDEIKTESVLSF
jgi:Lrp/AsnC family leucine-responsive transcriptional regulator